MTLLRLPSSAHGREVVLRHREAGEGPPLLLLHGGWGMGAYPFPPAPGFRALLPDRTGYGGSTPLDEMPERFHAKAAEEMRLYLDALGIGRARLWGHSDGAVIALHLALQEPERFPTVVAEATHLRKAKPASRAFFRTAATEPDAFGARLAAALEADHGARWRDVVRMNGRAWLRLAGEAKSETEDLYDGRLGEVRARVLLLHGARDPRTEPGELEALAAAIPGAEVALLAEGAHAPHSERAASADAARRALAFLR